MRPFRRDDEQALDFGDEPGRPWLVLGLVAFALVAVVVLFFAMRGSSQTSEGPPAGIATTEDFNPAAQEETAMGTTEATTQSTAESTDQSTAGSEGSGESSESEPDEDGPSDDVSDGSDVQRAGPEPGDIPDSGGGSGGGAGDRRSESETAAKETGVWDPAGIDPDPGDLTVTDKERVEFAASQFVTAVYGYTGEDPEEYKNEIDRMVVTEEFYRSAGGEKVEEYVDEVDVYGAASAAKVDRFEITETEPGKVVGVVHFDTADSYSRYGDLEGDKTGYTQKLVLVGEGETYTVFAAEARETGEES